jgi:hypothetical protein
MSDANNPGQVSVEGETYGNPEPNNSIRLIVPEERDVLEQVSNQGFPPAANGVDASTFPTPAEVRVTQTPTEGVVLSEPVPNAATVIVDEQCIGQGSWVPVDPSDPSAGKRFLPPGEFIVVGPDQSIQTNNSEETTVTCTITGVFDANNLWAVATSATTRFALAVSAPALTSYPISIQGRQIVFADDTLTSEIAGASRTITAFSTNYLVVDSNDPNDQTVPSLVILNPPAPPVLPQIGDTFTLDVQREGAQDISRVNIPTANVIIAPPPPAFVPNASQGLLGAGNVDVSTGSQPGQVIITSGVPAPTAINVNVADQATSVGLPTNVNVH